MKNMLIRSGFVVFIALLNVVAARADATLTFINPYAYITPGGTIEFDGTLTNTGDTDLYLNGDIFNLQSLDLTVDDSPFIFEGPTFLAAGDSFSGAFINVTADNEILPGEYLGWYTIQGGADTNTYDDLATEDFYIYVAFDTNPSSTTPEPTTFLLMISGFLIFTVLRLVTRG
jgi:hypothetical protein